MPNLKNHIEKIFEAISNMIVPSKLCMFLEVSRMNDVRQISIRNWKPSLFCAMIKKAKFIFQECSNVFSKGGGEALARELGIQFLGKFILTD